MRRKLKLFLEKSNVYLRLRYSPFALKIWFALHKSYYQEFLQMQFFFRHLLHDVIPGQNMVFDIGSNEGFTTQIFLDLNMKTIAVEPDRRNQRVLFLRFGQHKNFNFLRKEVSNSSAIEIPFLMISPGHARNTLSEKWKKLQTKNFDYSSAYSVGTLTLEELVNRFGTPCLLKIDVKGHEEEVLARLPGPIPLILFEANLPEYKDETLKIIDLLSKDSKQEFSLVTTYSHSDPAFVSGEKIRTLICEHQAPCDILCKMSNYDKYYNS